MAKFNLAPVFHSRPPRSTASVRASQAAAILRAAALATVVLFAGGATADRNLLANGGLEQVDAGGAFPGWTPYVWEGQGRVAAAETAAQGRRSAMIENSGPAKQALFQEFTLKPCRYRLTASVAAHGLRPNQWQQGAAVYFGFDSREQLFQNALIADSGWRRLELEFSLKKPAKTKLYLFNYGSGRVFFDDIALRPLAGCRDGGQTFRLAEKTERPLRYEPPMEPADFLLAGYCRDKGFTRSGVCNRLRKAEPAAPPLPRAAENRMLADFSSVQPFAAEGWRLVKLADGLSAGRISAGHYIEATPATGLAGDWRGYDWLGFVTDNPGDQPQKISIEVHDAATRDYWSRVNYDTLVPPGRSQFRLPLQIFVGEKSVIRERRRLDLARITRLVFSATDAGADVAIADIALTPEPPYANDSDRLLKLDAGPTTGPLMNGFMPLSADMHYTPERGYGFSSDAVLPHAEDRRHPDHLLRDWVSISKGGLDFDLPDGRYHVWMMLEDPGYWEYYPNFTRRKVTAEGRSVLDERMDAKAFFAKFYRHDDDEDLPGDDIWSRYVKARYQPLQFTTEVRDGQLNLRFDSEENPYALALSALVIYPAAEKQRGDAFLAEIWDRLKQHFNHEYRQQVPKHDAIAESPGNALDGRLTLFRRSAAVDVEAFAPPAADERIDALSLALAGDETAPLTLSLRPAADLKLTGVELDLPGLKVNPFQVRNKIERVTEDGAVYRSTPRLLDPLAPTKARPLHLSKGLNRRLWFDVTAPRGAKGGTLAGRLRLTFAGEAPLEVPVTVEVRPWPLPPADIPFGYLGTAPAYPGTAWPEVAVKAQTEMAAAILLLAEHGMNRYSGGITGPVYNGYRNGRVQMDFTAADKAMQLFDGHGKGDIDTYLGFSIQNLSMYRPDEYAGKDHGKSYDQVVADVLRAISEHGRTQKWRPLAYAVGDEPGGEDIDNTIQVAKAFRAADRRAMTSVFTSATDTGAPQMGFAGTVGRLYLNHHSEAVIRGIRARGSECALYNQNDRYRRGVYHMRLRQLGCAGHMQFAFNSVHVDPWYDLDGREADFVAVFTHGDGRLRPTVDLKRYREAITDYRYLLKLETSLARCSKADICREARDWFAKVLERMQVGHDRPQPWTPTELDDLRLETAKLIEQVEAGTKTARAK